MVMMSKSKMVDIAVISPYIKISNPECKIVYVARDFSNDDIKKFMEHGINAAICNQFPVEKIKYILGLILLGENYYPSEILPFNKKLC